MKKVNKINKMNKRNGDTTGSFGPVLQQTPEEHAKFWEDNAQAWQNIDLDHERNAEPPIMNTIDAETLASSVWITFIEQNQHILNLRPDQLMELGFVDGKMKEIDLDKTNKISDNILNELMPKKKNTKRKK